MANLSNDDILDLIDEAKSQKKKLAHITNKSKLSTQDKFKISLCRLFVEYMNEKRLTLKEFSEKTGIPNTRLSELTRYKIDLFNIDRILKYLDVLAKLSPKIREHLSMVEAVLDHPVMPVKEAKKLTKTISTYSKNSSYAY